MSKIANGPLKQAGVEKGRKKESHPRSSLWTSGIIKFGIKWERAFYLMTSNEEGEGGNGYIELMKDPLITFVVVVVAKAASSFSFYSIGNLKAIVSIY